MKTYEDAIAHIFGLLQHAYTRSEIDAAHRAYRTHLERWPEDRKLDLAHGTYSAIAALQERETLGKELGLPSQEFAYREELLRKIPNESEILWGLLGVSPRNEQAEKQREERIAMMIKWLKRYPADRHVINRLDRYKKDKEFEQDFYKQFREVEHAEEAAKELSHK